MFLGRKVPEIEKLIKAKTIMSDIAKNVRDIHIIIEIILFESCGGKYFWFKQILCSIIYKYSNLIK